MPRNRSLPPHLQIRRTGYDWRRHLPRSLRCRDLRSSAAPGEGTRTSSEKTLLCFSLRIHALRGAKILARRLTEMSDLVFAVGAETMMAVAPETEVQLLERLSRFEIEASERSRRRRSAFPRSRQHGPSARRGAPDAPAPGALPRRSGGRAAPDPSCRRNAGARSRRERRGLDVAGP